MAIRRGSARRTMREPRRTSPRRRTAVAFRASKESHAHEPLEQEGRTGGAAGAGEFAGRGAERAERGGAAALLSDAARLHPDGHGRGSRGVARQGAWGFILGAPPLSRKT